MLTKLLKHEFKATWRVLGPVSLGVLALSCMTALLNCAYSSIPALRQQTFFTLLSGSVEVFTFLGLGAVVLACMFLSISRFYKLLGEQGYLLLTLPVRPFDHMAAKLICAMANMGAVLVLVAFCGGLISAGNADLTWEDVGAAVLGVFSVDTAQALPAILMLVVLMLLAAAGGILFLYLCIAIGSHWSQQRLLASIAAYFGLSFAGQVVFLVLAAVVGFVAYNGLMDSDATFYLNWMLSVVQSGNAAAIAYGAGAVVLLLVAAYDAILWAITQWLMTKKLNLP